MGDKRVNSRIKRVRLRFSLTQGQLGQKIGRTAAYINQIERGKVEPTETVINTIADVLEIDKGWLRTGEGEMMKETDLRPVGDRIRQVRVEFGENQANFAEMLGVSRNTISLLECGKITVSGKIIKVLVEKYEIDENWLRTGRGEMYESEEIVRMYEILERDEDVRKMLIGFLWRRYEGEIIAAQPR